jgi:hypothetical protein
MHSRELAELAPLVAVHASALAEDRACLPHAAIEEYWAASKCRLDRWLRVLRQLAACDASAPPPTLAWPRVRPVLEEILVSELLTRLWTATSVACDMARGDQDLEPVTRNIFAGHLEARRRLLQLMAECRAIGPERVTALNQLRRRIERWSDMLLAHLADTVDTREFAFELERHRDFADDLGHRAVRQQQGFTCQLIQASLRAALAQGLADRTPNADLNRRIGSAVLSCFREELIEAPALVKALWLERVTRTARDTEEMVEALLRLDANLPTVGRGP